ncbi:MAG: TIGR04255 family protein [Bacteroidetes bacterium]|nr:TIGR04255 family protein [Bacteroidota bacterium]
MSNAPLQEVILDIKWNLDFDTDSQLFIDTGFAEAVLKFSSLVSRDHFTSFEILRPEILPNIAFNYKPVYRFRKPDLRFPLYQLGPGIFSINSNNEHYTWEGYYELVQKGVQFLQASYAKPLVIKSIELRYIDNVPINILGDTDKFEFLEKHLNVKAEKYSFTEGSLEGINFIKKFKINDTTFLNIDIATGYDTENKQEGVTWHTIVYCIENILWSDFNNWLNEAHQIASETFKKMINKPLYDKFSN